MDNKEFEKGYSLQEAAELLGRSVVTVRPVSPSSPCSSVPAAASPASWPPVPLKTNVTAV